MARKDRKLTSRLPVAEDFAAGAVQKAVLSETVQSPLTIFPAAVSVISALYMAIISMNKFAFGVAIGSAFLSAGSWVYQYFFRGEQLAEEHIKNLREKRNLYKRQEADSLQEQCASIGFQEGAKEAWELKSAFEKLHDFLNERLADERNLNAQRFLVLAEDTYYEGVSMLRNAMETFKVLKNIDLTILKQELQEWRKEIVEYEKNQEKYKHRIEALKTKIESHEKRLRLHRDRTDLLHQLLAQCEVLEAALDTAYLEAVDLVNHGEFQTKSETSTNLERAVKAARRVEERLKGNTRQAEEDEIYLTSGKKKLKRNYPPFRLQEV